ncbi:MAG: ribosomal RNA small subunit methyltransferase A [Chitinophagaceae bacterium]|nr:ribosomal RNA small subunit methyltransferase A [Chitinophagaceae bacterium]
MDYTLKKSLGQHFLHDESICERIVEAVNTQCTKLVEVGPGAGAITKYLFKKNIPEFRCIELDKEKVDYLMKKYPELKDKIIHDDILDAEKPFEGHFHLIGNFPYNISTQIVFKILDWRDVVDEATGMFQKEVAQRIASIHGNKNYGILSVLTQCFYDVTYLFEVDETAFTPPPKVKSAVIQLKKNNNPYHIDHYEKFKSFVKVAFNQRRKTLRNGLKSILPPEKLQDKIFDKRAEQLSVKEIADLFHTLYSV